MAILDSLADDFEGVPQIINYLSYLEQNVIEEEVLRAIHFLETEGLIFINKDISDNEFIWYGLTENGRYVWNNITKFNNI